MGAACTGARLGGVAAPELALGPPPPPTAGPGKHHRTSSAAAAATPTTAAAAAAAAAAAIAGAAAAAAGAAGPGGRGRAHRLRSCGRGPHLCHIIVQLHIHVARPASGEAVGGQAGKSPHGGLLARVLCITRSLAHGQRPAAAAAAACTRQALRYSRGQSRQAGGQAGRRAGRHAGTQAQQARQARRRRRRRRRGRSLTWPPRCAGAGAPGRCRT